MLNTYTGINFKKKYGNIHFKALNDNLIHFNFTYKEGINIDTKNFNPTGSCEGGGLYFTNLENINDYLELGTKLGIINILDDSLVYVDGNKFKANKIEILNICLIENSILFSNKTEAEYINIVNKNGLMLKYIKNQTNEIYKTAVTQNGMSLQYVPEKLKSDEIYEFAVTQNGAALKYVPNELRSEKLCKKAVEKNKMSMYYVQDEYIFTKICICMPNVYTGIEFKKIFGHIFYKILNILSFNKYTKGINIDADRFDPIDPNWREISFVKYENLYDDIKYTRCVDYCCSINILDDSLVYVGNFYFMANKIEILDICLLEKSVFFENKTEDEYINLVNKDGLLLKYIKNQTNEICKTAVFQNGKALHYVLEPLKSYEICELAVKQDGWSLGHVPKTLQSEKLYEIAVAQKGSTLELVPKELRSDKMCEMAVRQNGNALEFVPEELKSDEMCEIAVAQTEYALKFVPMVKRSTKIYKIVLAKDWHCLMYMYKQHITEELCKFAVAQNGNVLQFVPQIFKTPEICEIAISQNANAVKHAPGDFLYTKIQNNNVDNGVP